MFFHLRSVTAIKEVRIVNAVASFYVHADAINQNDDDQKEIFNQNGEDVIKLDVFLIKLLIVLELIFIKILLDVVIKLNFLMKSSWCLAREYYLIHIIHSERACMSRRASFASLFAHSSEKKLWSSVRVKEKKKINFLVCILRHSAPTSR